jgi:hypothetical protein
MNAEPASALHADTRLVAKRKTPEIDWIAFLHALAGAMRD